jgi:hypothetical protein
MKYSGFHLLPVDEREGEMARVLDVAVVAVSRTVELEERMSDEEEEASERSMRAMMMPCCDGLVDVDDDGEAEDDDVVVSFSEFLTVMVVLLPWWLVVVVVFDSSVSEFFSGLLAVDEDDGKIAVEVRGSSWMTATTFPSGGKTARRVRRVRALVR